MPIPSGQTNVASLRMGAGVLDGLGREIGRFVVATMDVPWDVAGSRLGGTPEAVVMISSVGQRELDRHVADLPPCDAVVGVGGGQAVDAGKYFAWKRGLRLVTVPTILSVDAFVTPAAGVRIDHEVHYVGETTPDPLVVDFDVIRTAPPSLNVAGIGDLLSIHTATVDWELAHRAGRSEYPFSAVDVARARGILDELYGLLPEIRDVTDAGLRAIVEGYMRMNAICLPAGHYRVEEGSEHYLFYELEERLRRPFIHGPVVGLGIYLMSRLQGNAPEAITRVMNDVGLAYHPADFDLRRDDLEASLGSLRAFVQARDRLGYTVIDEVEITPDFVAEALAELRF